MQRTAFFLLTPSSHLCLALPRLLAFHPRPLSNPWEEADGPVFLCTNQEGICSLTDTSPLTHASSHIHYSFSQRWAAVQGWEQSGGCADWVKKDTGRGWWVLVVLCSCCHLILTFKCPLVLLTRQRTSWDISIKTLQSFLYFFLSCTPTLNIFFMSCHVFFVLFYFMGAWDQPGKDHRQNDSVASFWPTENIFKFSFFFTLQKLLASLLVLVIMPVYFI